MQLYKSGYFGNFFYPMHTASHLDNCNSLFFYTKFDFTQFICFDVPASVVLACRLLFTGLQYFWPATDLIYFALAWSCSFKIHELHLWITANIFFLHLKGDLHLAYANWFYAFNFIYSFTNLTLCLWFFMTSFYLHRCVCILDLNWEKVTKPRLLSGRLFHIIGAKLHSFSELCYSRYFYQRVLWLKDRDGL